MLLTCAFGIITALALEHLEDNPRQRCSEMTGQILAALCDLTDKRHLLAFSLVMALNSCGLCFLDAFAFRRLDQSAVLVTGNDHRLGGLCRCRARYRHKPRRLRWRLVFLPLPAMLVMIGALIYIFS